MKVIIAGSRNITDFNTVKRAIEASEYNITEIVSGAAIGVDQLGEEYAIQNNIDIKIFTAKVYTLLNMEWSVYGKSAGYKRNEQMAEYADALIAIWDGVSKGTKHMIDIMRVRNKANFVYIPGNEGIEIDIF